LQQQQKILFVHFTWKREMYFILYIFIIIIIIVIASKCGIDYFFIEYHQQQFYIMWFISGNIYIFETAKKNSILDMNIREKLLIYIEPVTFIQQNKNISRLYSIVKFDWK